LYVEVVTALERLDRGIGIALQVAEGKTGRLVLGYVEPLGINLLPRALIGFRQLHPGIDLRLLEMHTVDQARALHDGMIDCGLLRAPANADPGLEFEQVWRDELVVAVPQRHRLARHRGAKLDLVELTEEHFIVYEPSLGTGILTATLSGCASAGFTPMVAQSAQSTPMLLSLVAAGDGVALVSGEVARVPRPGVTFAPLAGPGIYSEVLLAWRAGEESAARENLRHLIQRMGVTRP
jgi:DNA-binding transcriptional LysR family regulator